VTEPRRAEKDSGKLWTNNNSETMNHVLKMAVDWKPKATPELISSGKLFHDFTTLIAKEFFSSQILLSVGNVFTVLQKVFEHPTKARKIATKPGQRKRGLNERTIPKR
jgi:hypothetical protein